MDLHSYLPLILAGVCIGPVLLIGLSWLVSTISEANHKRQGWQIFAREIGGRFVAGEFGREDQVVASIDKWPFILDTCVTAADHMLVTFTRIRAFYHTLDGFQLRVQTGTVLTDGNLLPKLRHVPMPADSKMHVQANDELKAQTVLDQTGILPFMASDDATILQARPRRNWRSAGVSTSVYEIIVEQRGIVTAPERLKRIHTIVQEVLAQLHTIGSASRSFVD